MKTPTPHHANHTVLVGFRTVLLTLSSLVASAPLFASNAMAHCQLPTSNAAYGAAVAKVMIRIIQPYLPAVHFDPSFSNSSTHMEHEGWGLVEPHETVLLRAMDGTQLAVDGDYIFFPKDLTDAEGNITGCSLWVMEAVFQDDPVERARPTEKPTISSITNTSSGDNLLHLSDYWSELHFDGSAGDWTTGPEGPVDLGVTYTYQPPDTN